MLTILQEGRAHISPLLVLVGSEGIFPVFFFFLGTGTHFRSNVIGLYWGRLLNFFSNSSSSFAELIKEKGCNQSAHDRNIYTEKWYKIYFKMFLLKTGSGQKTSFHKCLRRFTKIVFFANSLNTLSYYLRKTETLFKTAECFWSVEFAILSTGMGSFY